MSWREYSGYYVYVYLDSNGIPYYVGKGIRNRMIAKHLYASVPDYSNIMVMDKLSEQDAWDKEIELIAKYGREHLKTGPLKNLTAGGPTQKNGWAQSSQAKEKISKGNLGKIRTLAQRLNYSKPKTKEHAEKIRQANLGRLDDGRYVKTGLTQSMKRWYNNGIITKMCVPGSEPDGFISGRKLGKKSNVMA